MMMAVVVVFNGIKSGRQKKKKKKKLTMAMMKKNRKKTTIQSEMGKAAMDFIVCTSSTTMYTVYAVLVFQMRMQLYG